MNETRRKPTTGRQSPYLCDKCHGIFYMPSRIDEAGHTKAFGYPVAEHWGESRNVQFRRWDSNRQHISLESNVLPTEPPRFSSLPRMTNPDSRDSHVLVHTGIHVFGIYNRSLLTFAYLYLLSMLLQLSAPCL